MINPRIYQIVSLSLNPAEETRGESELISETKSSEVPAQ